MGPSGGHKTLAFPFQQVAELVELGKILCKDDVVDTVDVLDLALRDDDNAGIVLQERFPPVQPVRLEGIAGAENT